MQDIGPAPNNFLAGATEIVQDRNLQNSKI